MFSIIGDAGSSQYPQEPFSPPFRLGLLDFSLSVLSSSFFFSFSSPIIIIFCMVFFPAHTFLLATTGSSSIPQTPSQLTPSHWRRRDPPVSLRIPQFSSPLSSAPAHPSAQLQLPLPIGDDGIPQCASGSLKGSRMHNYVGDPRMHNYVRNFSFFCT